MTGPTHVIAAMVCATYVPGFAGLDAIERLAAYILSAAGGLLPDIDHPTSGISQYVGPVSKVFNWLEAKVMPAGMQHRGITHTPLLVLALLGWWWVSGQPAHALLLIVGIASHQLIDTFTVAGIPLFWPFFWRRLRLGNIKTGEGGEALVRKALWIWLVAREIAIWSPGTLDYIGNTLYTNIYQLLTL